MTAESTHKNWAEIKATRKLRWWYESLADAMLTNPQATQQELAAEFGRTPTTISLIINTDAFKAYYAQRRRAHEEKLGYAIQSKLMDLTRGSIDAMLSTLEKKRDTIPLESLQRMTEMGLKSMGLSGDKPQPQVVINNTSQNVSVPISANELHAAREALRANQAKQIEATPYYPDTIEDEIERPLVETPAPLSFRREE